MQPEMEQVFREVTAEQKGNGKDKGSLRYVLYDDIDNVPKTWVVDNFLGVAEVSCWYGEPGSGKSVVVEDLGLHVAAKFSRWWLGRELLTHGAVIYIALERPNLVKRRALAFKKKHNAQGLPFAIVDEAHDFRNAKTAELILQTVAEIERKTGQKVVLIIVDTISRALCGGDENSPKDMGALVSTLSLIQARCNAHMLLTHHVPHEQERMRGHGSLLGAVDTTVFVQKGTPGRSATVVKTNDSDEGERVTFTLESVDISPTTTAPVVVGLAIGETLTADVTTKAKLTDSQWRFMDILKQAINDRRADPTKVPRAAGGQDAVTRGFLKYYLLQRGWLDEDGNKARAKMSNTLNALAGKKVINLADDYVWLV